MSKIITLKDRITQESIYPITTTSAVLDRNGKSIEILLTEKSEELDIKAAEAISRAKAAEDSITSLNNLNNTALAQEELNKIKTQVETNKSDITELKGKYDELRNITNNIVKTDELVNNIETESSQVPTTVAVKTYVEEKSSELLSYLISTTTTDPNYAPNTSGQVLINTVNNTIYFSPGGSTFWFALEATPLELPSVLLEGFINRGYNHQCYARWFLSQAGKAIDCNSMITGSSPVGTSNSFLPKGYAPLAQLDRVSDYESGGCEFDSCKARQLHFGM